MKLGEPIPDHMVMKLISERINKLDCKINGWILDGFPHTVNQLNLLKEYNFNPSLVILLEVSDHLVYERLEHRRFDPLTGLNYNTMLCPPDNDTILGRLV
jgi:adenylate kinase